MTWQKYWKRSAHVKREWTAKICFSKESCISYKTIVKILLVINYLFQEGNTKAFRPWNNVPGSCVVVLITKATDHLKWCSDYWCSWIGCGLPGHGNVWTFKNRQSSYSKSGKKIAKSETLNKLKIACKIPWGMFCTGAGERLHFNISSFLLLCTEHGGMFLKGGTPI